MPLKTLCGIFDEPKKTPKKNFIRENIKSIKQLQELLQEAQRTKEHSKSSLERKQSSKKSIERTPSLERSKSNSKESVNEAKKENFASTNGKSIEKTLTSIAKFQNMSKLKGSKANKIRYKPQCSDRSVQTELEFDCCSISKLKERGDVKQPVIKSKERLSNKIEKSVIKQDESAGGFYSVKSNDQKVKETVVLEPQCPPGHVLLLETERVDTLKTLKQNYQKLIHQLNSLSLTCDTLRIKKKRMELEEDLRRLDDAIKIFERHKVYVKQ